MSFGDIITYICLAIAIWYVPRYLLRVYAPGVMPWLRSWWQAGIDTQRERYERRAASYGLRDVNNIDSSAKSSSVVMSRTPEPDRRLIASVSETDGKQSSDRQTIAKPTEQQMLDIFKALRAAGVKREAIAGPWRAAGLPIDTNLWSKAAPSEKDDDDDTIVTPWAGRRTKASYYDDPRLEYQQPPN
jgi:hypothetical protein